MDLLAHPELLVSVAGFDPGRWRLVHFELWRTAAEPAPELAPNLAPARQVRIYGVGHVSAAGAAT